MAQTLFVPRPDENRQFEKLIIEHYLLNVHIQHDHANTDVEVVFSNPNEESIDGIFIIPFYKTADNLDFEVRIDGKVIPIKLAKKEKLIKIYGNTFQAMDYDILESLGSSHLQTKVLQIPGGGQCRVQILYDESIEKTDDNFVYTHNLQSNQSVGNFDMTVVVEGYYEIETVNSPSHDVAISKANDKRVCLTYQSADVKLDNDFICSYSLTEGYRTAAELLCFEEEMVVSDVSAPVPSGERFDAVTLSIPDVSQQQTSLHRGAVRLSERRVLQSNIPMSLGLTPPNCTAYHDVFFKGHGTNPFMDTEDDNMSTFGMDADSASYSVTRRYLQDGHLPPPEAVRVEEFINAFDYNYSPPTDAAFAVHLEGVPSKFGKGKRLQLLRIGIQGLIIPDTDRKDANLTFVIRHYNELVLNFVNLCYTDLLSYDRRLTHDQFSRSQG